MKKKERPLIRIKLEPENRELEIRCPKTVQQLLAALELRATDCLVIRDEGSERCLLTYDLQINPNDKLTVRKVASSG